MKKGLIVTRLLIVVLAIFIFCAQNSLAQSLDDGDFKTLIGYLESNDVTVQKDGITVLGDAREKKAVPYLLPMLKNVNPEIKACVCDALREIGDKRAVASLIETLKDKNQKVREAATMALREILRYGK